MHTSCASPLQTRRCSFGCRSPARTRPGAVCGMRDRRRHLPMWKCTEEMDVDRPGLTVPLMFCSLNFPSHTMQKGCFQAACVLDVSYAATFWALCKMETKGNHRSFATLSSSKRPGHIAAAGKKEATNLCGSSLFGVRRMRRTSRSSTKLWAPQSPTRPQRLRPPRLRHLRQQRQHQRQQRHRRRRRSIHSSGLC